MHDSNHHKLIRSKKTQNTARLFAIATVFSAILFSSMTISTLIPDVNAISSGFDEPITLDGKEGKVGYDSSIAIGTDQNPMISYRDLENEDLKIVHCLDPVCDSFANPITLDSQGMVGRDSSIVIGADGNPIVSYYDRSNKDLKVVHCNDKGCTSFDDPIVLDSMGDVGRDSSMAIGTDGNPVISYFDNSNNSLKLVHCAAIDCSSFDVPITLDNEGAVGRDSSIAIGTDDNPVISYTDDTFGNLKIIHCLDVNCMSKDTPVVLDNGEATGVTPSVAIGADGYPIVSYFDALTSDLKIVHCNAINCSLYDNTF